MKKTIRRLKSELPKKIIFFIDDDGESAEFFVIWLSSKSIPSDLMWSDVVGRSHWICNLLLLFIWMMMRKDQFKRAFSSCVFPPKCVSNKLKRWQWLRLRWQSGRFLSQRSTVQIRSLAKNLQLTCLLLVALKSRLERKSAGYGPLKIAI